MQKSEHLHGFLPGMCMMLRKESISRLLCV
ncbi:hypothetical protein PDIG_12830 [Penicillium digitatum PHI26]|uniref:Uncharacterized protein n=2 Tax=Penicillium digitatum TaxID=36651 RepID=K9G7J2_PEND2|nr:hypothetical protein PDIP_39050 [Penicillium digitatum Pd1]EKV15830.1 hypothetical protein PDIP_39050 [Penicillium digitatum Pd1]EKV17895.1 hypothetical protein PDIG_12830 [Penicillium digitatum PHI26]